MVTDVVAIRTYFSKLGLESEVADIYLALHTHGPQTISALSRSSGVERTRIYRLIDMLMETNLTELESTGQRGVIKAAPIANLHILITQKEQELKSLQDELGLIEQVLARNSLSSPAVRVQLYQGREGVRQMLRGELRAVSGIIGYSYHDLESYAGKDFVEDWQRQLKTHNLQREMLPSHQIHASLTHSCSIYNDVIAHYYEKNGEVYGSEIYNQEAADVQRTLLAPLLKHSI